MSDVRLSEFFHSTKLHSYNHRRMKEAERRALIRAFDQEYRKKVDLLAGLDEAGRGPLAGPVVVAAVIMSCDSDIPYVFDSKKLSEKRRESVYEDIQKEALAIGIGIVGPEEIDRINILQATYQAAREAVYSLPIQPDLLLNDALKIPALDLPQEAIVKGDAKSYSIACASIIAKVTRDRMMVEYDKTYPGYQFSSHKGYGTKAHYEALKKIGLCPIHRRSFLKNLADK